MVRPRRLVHAFTILSLVLLATHVRLSAEAPPPSSFGEIGRGLVENRGQWPDEVVYQYQSPGVAAWFTRDGLVIDRFSETREPAGEMRRGGQLKEMLSAPARVRGCVLRTRFVNARPTTAIEARNPLPGAHHFFLGDQASRWRSDAQSFSEIRYRGLYEGIDIVYRFDARSGLKYDAIVAPGADPRAIRLRYEGAAGVALSESGDLQIRTSAGDFLEERPEVYQERGGRRVPVAAAYRIEEGGDVSFAIENYDRSLPLVIDPRLSWSTYVGGSGTDAAFSIATAPDGGVFVAGFTRSATFPTTKGAYDRTANGGFDTFVSKFDAEGRLIFCTLLGGSADDGPSGLASDALGNPIVVGGTASSSFPTTPDALDRTYGGDGDGFVTKLTANGGALIYSTFLGAADNDAPTTVVVDESGAAIVGGFTSSSAFPTTPDAFDPTYNGGYEGFITHLNADATAIMQSSFLGGISDDLLMGATLLPDGVRLIVGGSTQSDDFPTTPNAYDRSANGAQDGFLAVYDLSQGALALGTFIGGLGQETAYTVTADASGRPMLAGETDSFDFPITSGAFDGEIGGGTDGFITKLNQSGSDLVFSTFLGGNESFDYVQAIVAVPNGWVLATGATLSSDFPVTAGIFGGTPYAGGIADAFVTMIGKRGESAVYSTCLGGSDGDAGYAVVLGADSRAVAVGYAASTDYPTTPGAYDRSWNGGLDAYVTALPVITGGAAGKTGPELLALSPIALSVESPARRTIDARLELSRSGAVVVELVDVSGRRLFRKLYESVPEGASRLQIDVEETGASLAAGVYHLRATAGAATASQKIVLLP